jgi:uncharacterized membrane protein
VFKLIKLHNILYHLRASFWFLPALMAGGAIALSLTTMLIDRNWISGEGLPFWLIFNGDPESARTVLSVIAGSMMTVAGVVFSITIVALSVVSLALLIYFIHNVSESIQAENIIARVRRDLEKSVERLFPEPFSAEDDPPPGPIHP